MKVPRLFIWGGILVLLFLLTQPLMVNTESMIDLADPEAEYKLLCRNEYRLEYEKKGHFQTTAIASAPVDLAEFCEQKIRAEAKPRFFYGQPLCSPNAQPDCQNKFTLVVDVTSIKRR